MHPATEFERILAIRNASEGDLVHKGRDANGSFGTFDSKSVGWPVESNQLFINVPYDLNNFKNV